MSELRDLRDSVRQIRAEMFGIRRQISQIQRWVNFFQMLGMSMPGVSAALGGLGAALGPMMFIVAMLTPVIVQLINAALAAQQEEQAFNLRKILEERDRKRREELDAEWRLSREMLRSGEPE